MSKTYTQPQLAYLLNEYAPKLQEGVESNRLGLIKDLLHCDSKGVALKLKGIK